MEIQWGEEDDICIWSLNVDDNFSTKITWEWAQLHNEKKFWAKTIWNTILPPKISIFLW